ncbi:MAG TPA: response regulator transcription factor [Acidimicrobiales bacterium]|nr:response regulator transcription factor [Acidimicrobiales bacterium]
MEPRPLDLAADPDPSISRVLVVEDDRNLADVVARYLERDGFEVEVVHDGDAGLRRALESLPDLVVLDLMLPGLHGIEVFRRLRQVAPIPVVMLTARGSEEDKVTGLELGADDYVAKPFSPRELTARVRAVLRRASASVEVRGSSVLRAGALELDLVAHEARRDGEPLPLTARELDLLAYLMAHPRRAFTRRELLREVWGHEIGDTATVTVHVQRLRDKAEADPRQPQHLRTVRGIGYRFEP